MPKTRPRRRPPVLVAAVLACLLAAGAAAVAGAATRALAAPAVAGVADVGVPVPSRDRSETAPGPVIPTPQAQPSRPPQPPPPQPPAGPVCANTWDVATTTGPVMGWGGNLLRFHVAVEQGILFPITDFTDHVVRTLSDPRSWVGYGTIRLQQVAGWEYADFTIYLACPWTSYDMCRTGGLDTRRNGYPYTSCRVGNWVVINDDRFQGGAASFTAAGGTLQEYQYYVINHEVGHRLGHGHAHCAGYGRLADIMQQQTLRMEGCVANGWPNPWVAGNPPPQAEPLVPRSERRPFPEGYFFP